METALYFLVHLLEHGFAVEGVHAPAEEAEVHVEVRAPGCVVRAGFLVVALKVDWSGCRLCGCLKRGHQSNLRLRDFGSIRVMPPPTRISERRLPIGNVFI